MRDILFRGKRTDNGKWVYGLLCRVGDTYANIRRMDTEVLYSVLTNTIGQYTGLTDKNGRKIFEGDICRMKADRLKGYGAIIFMGSAFVLCDKTHKKTRYYPLYPDGQFTVVGNIHDNPELLEEKE